MLYLAAIHKQICFAFHAKSFKHNYLLCLIFFSWTLAQPKAEKGILDLRAWDFSQNGAVDLDGEWQFFYHDFLSAAQLDSLSSPVYLKVPSASWQEIGTWQEQKINGHGYATYYLKVLLPTNSPSMLSIKTLDQSSAFKVLVNTKEVISLGRIGKSAEQMFPNPGTAIGHFEPHDDTLNIVIHISNFYHRKGGLWYSMQLGTPEQVLQIRDKNLSIALFLSGSLWLMFLYHLFLFLIRKKENSVLFFALLCLIVPVRVLSTSENYIVNLMPFISWDWKYRFEYISFFLIPPFLYSFLQAVFPQDIPRIVTRFFYFVAILFSIIALFTTANFFTYLLLPYYGVSFIAIIFASYGLFRALIYRREGARLFISGILFLIFTVINDILYSSLIINTTYLIPWGFFIFFFSQAALLSMRFSNAFVQVENLSEELKKYNENLESLVEERTNNLQQTVQVIEKQKNEIEHKNKEITASITYAKRIQSAILSKVANVEQNLVESFIFFQPRDIVSGDFYWFAQKTDYGENKLIIVVADCTGHGVPGAFMSMIGDSLLNQIVHDREIHQPDLILYEMNKGVRRLLNQQHTQNRDGMHMGIVAIDFNAHTMVYAGAKSPLIYFQNQQFMEIKGERTSIGGILDNKHQYKNFENHTIYLPSLNGQPQNKTMFYLFTDGYTDQFGGKEGGRFSKIRMRKLLYEIHQLPLHEQKKILEQNLVNWMRANSGRQIDDILVVGIKI